MQELHQGCEDGHEKKVTDSGLTTHEALLRLHNAISDEVNAYEEELETSKQQYFKGNIWFWDAFHHNSAYSLFRWPSILMLVTVSILLLVCYSQKDDVRYGNLILETLLFLVIAIANTYLVCFDNQLRHYEVLNKAKSIVSYLKRCVEKCQWQPNYYPQLNAPTSPCITLQWTYRDGKMVNLHWSLLVEGDVVVLRPGQEVPAKCRSIKNPDDELKSGDIYAPFLDCVRESFSSPQIRIPRSTGNYVLLETPYIKSLRFVLQMSQNRPLTYFDRERHIVSVCYLEQMFVPILLVLMLTANTLRYVYLWNHVGHWTEMLIVLQIEVVIPMLPLTFPLMWILLNAYGMTRLATLYYFFKKRQRLVQPMDKFANSSAAHTGLEIRFTHVKEYFCDILCGRDRLLYRTANLLHVLGSITSLCCVDKKGILSWPNPTPEKVFFLRSCDATDSGGGLCISPRNLSNDSLVIHSVAENVCGDVNGLNQCEFFADPVEQTQSQMANQSVLPRSAGVFYDFDCQESRVEVLDLTHDIQVPFKVQFDDQKWMKHIHSLKPLGLSILLNTCNPNTQDHYTHFSSHIACEALSNDVVVPVINRRCLCELASHIGFVDQAMDVFQLQQQLSTFRHVQPGEIRRDKLARSLAMSKLKFPFPHMASVVVKELNTGMLQLMSQGTGDIILDSCSDFWDGQDLVQLTELDRKKILDFYHRTSLTAYCTAFAYRPLTSGVSGDLSNVYLEIPSFSGRLYSSFWSPSPTRCWDSQSGETRVKVMNRCLSSDSLLGHIVQDCDLVDNAEACFEIQCNQVFIGMVAMQYQPRMDMVHLIEQLDKACIRFVHFSKENELRSRVFSEKMGLESGWNCHVSLLSPRARSESGNSAKASKSSLNRKMVWNDDTSSAVEGPRSPKVKHTLEAMQPLSYSAPSAINLDVTTVKFGEDISMHDVTAATETCSRASGQEAMFRSNDSPHMSTSINVEDDVPEDLTEALIGQRQVNDGRFSNHPSRSPSHVTESTEQSVPITFDMSNRAKLPKGIENIRPHLENVDNVPLLVSLFTDCTPAATREMIKIMQEYGEVVCCIGSSATSQNIPVFMQADASISLEPLYPQVCVRQPTCDCSLANGPLPMEIAKELNSLPCTLNFYHEDKLSIYELIMEARHFTMALRSCFRFLLASSLSLSVIIFLSSVLLLPPPLRMAHIFMFVLFSFPLLSASLIGRPKDDKVMSLATGKNADIVTKQALFGFIGYSTVQFLPSVCVCLVCFILILTSVCQSTSANAECKLLLGNVNYTHSNQWNGWSEEYADSFFVVQDIVGLLFILYQVLISASFVHESHLFWQRNPFVNKLWCLAIVTVVLVQGMFFIINIYKNSNEQLINSPILESIPPLVLVVSMTWPFCLLAINELMKMHNIKVDVRYQKKARLEFGTKLGMNSPF